MYSPFDEKIKVYTNQNSFYTSHLLIFSLLKFLFSQQTDYKMIIYILKFN